MNPPCVVPICPPAPISSLVRYFKISGWAWDDALLDDTLSWLEQQDICDVCDLTGLNITELEDSDFLAVELKHFLQQLTAVLRSFARSCDMSRVSVHAGFCAFEHTCGVFGNIAAATKPVCKSMQTL